MVKNRDSGIDYENRYLDSLEGDVKEIKETVRLVLNQTQKTNGRVTKLEGEVKILNTKVLDVPAKKDLPSIMRDPKVIQILLYFSLTLLLIASYVTNFDITRIIP